MGKPKAREFVHGLIGFSVLQMIASWPCKCMNWEAMPPLPNYAPESSFMSKFG